MTMLSQVFKIYFISLKTVLCNVKKNLYCKLSLTLLFQESEPSVHFSPLESNTVLENIISEVLSSKSDQSCGACSVDEAQNSVSIEDLELVQRKLQEEFEERRSHFMSNLSNKCSQ